MKLQLVVILMVVAVVDFTDGQYPNCVSCADGLTPLSPLSYKTVRSNTFNGIQPSNEACTHGIDGGATTNCGQDTTLVDCDQGFDGDDYSDFSNSFIWNNTIQRHVFIEFRFDQQVNISNISMFFWNSQSNSILVPDVRMYWAHHTLSFDEITITAPSPDRTKDGQYTLNINITDTRQLKLQYLRINMSFYDESKWIFLGEVQFCGNVPPFHITQPSTDNVVQFVSPIATMVNLTCSLNVTIPSSMIVEWRRYPDASSANHTTLRIGNTMILVLKNFQPSDAGVYQCLFSDTFNSIWILARNITLRVNTNTITSKITITTSTVTTNMATATTITTTAVAATVVPSTNTSTDVNASSSDDPNVGVIVAPIIVIIVLLMVVVIVLIILFIYRRKQLTHHAFNDDTKLTKQCSGQAKEEKITEKKKSLELQKKESKFTQSEVSTTDIGAMEFDLYANIEHNQVSRSAKVNTTAEDPIYREAINPAAIVNSLSHDNDSDYDDLCPYGSIYADPLPLVQSERPPIVSNKNIEQVHPLGVGQFGEVVLAKTVGLSFQYLGIGKSKDTTISIKVAVKTLKSAVNDETRKLFEKEIKFMSRLKNDNVVRLLGICTTDTPFIMMEYMEHGDLNHYLQKFKFTYEAKKLPAANEITLNALVYMSFQIAGGMEYLSSLKFVHRDLAARNVLVGVNFTVKVADFGMSRDLYGAAYCKITGRNVLPIRWMAYECFFGKFSIPTDVWAFGITLWEIFTLCRKLPYDDLSDKEMIEDAIKGANRRTLNQPSICPNEMYGIMTSCFQHEPSERPRFNVLCDQLNDFYTKIL